jgi:DNA repair protein RecO (recombination protein O)
MLIKTKAIVISSLKYGEADLIVKCFTQSSGLKSYLLRNVLKSKKGKLRTSLFQPLTHLDIEANHKDKGNLERIREAKVTYHFKSLHTDVVKSSIVLFLSEVLRSSIQEEEENISLFQFLEYATLWLDSSIEIANFHLLFLLNLTQYLGFYPETTSQKLPFFNLLEGTFEPLALNVYCYNDTRISLLKRLLGTNFDTLAQIKLNQNERSAFLQMLLQYYEVHLHGFKQPRSLAVLNTIFQ